MTQQATIYFIHSFFTQIWLLTQLKMCQVPCHPQKWIRHGLACVSDISNSTPPFWNPTFPVSSHIYQHLPSPHPEKHSVPFLAFFISQNCSILHPVAHAKNLRAHLPFSLLFLTAHFVYMQILSTPFSKHIPNAFASLPLYCLLCNPSHCHLSHGILRHLQ